MIKLIKKLSVRVTFDFGSRYTPIYIETLELTKSKILSRIIFFTPKILLHLTLLLSVTTSFAQETKNTLFIEPEYMVGRVIPNYVARFPNTYLQHGLALSVGTFKTDSTSIWAKYYNYPQTGVTLFYSYIGNNKVFGHQFSIMPFIGFNIFNKLKKPYYFKASLGAAYFTSQYDSVDNRKNVNVSSPFTWAFQLGAYKTLTEKPGMNLKVGIIFSHASNGHTQIPNFGLNSALLSLSAQFYNKNTQQYQLTQTKRKKEKKTRSYDIGISYGLGLHEYGETNVPVGGPKKGVQSTSVFAAKTYNHHFRWGIGATYRFYHTYYQQITDRNLEKYIDEPNKNASNIVLFTNVEFLMSHFSMDIELGFNIYKPFYKQYEEDFPVGKQFKGYSEFKRNFKRTITTRLGLNFYLINTNKLPKHNFYIGPHIKANAGQADFSEIAIGYVYRLN